MRFLSEINCVLSEMCTAARGTANGEISCRLLRMSKKRRRSTATRRADSDENLDILDFLSIGNKNITLD